MARVKLCDKKGEDRVVCVCVCVHVRVSVEVLLSSALNRPLSSPLDCQC